MSEELIPVVAVVGPTASGKTALSVELAKKLGAEILSFDSMQLYKGMDIATAKPTKEEMQGVPHHMIDTVDPDEIFSVAKYKQAADSIISDIHSRGKRVIMAGGTGLYLDTVIDNIELLEDSGDRAIRERLKKELEEYGIDHMHKRLSEVDPDAAAAIHKNNTSRVIRALELYEATGHTMSFQVENSRKTPSPYKAVYIGLNARNRDFLYDRINRRVDLMLESGLIDEAKEFLETCSDSTSRQAIGLKELAPFIRGERSVEDCIEKIKQETRRYAKRQLTWFRRNDKINWLYIDEMNLSELTKEAERIIFDSGIFSEEVCV